MSEENKTDNQATPENQEPEQSFAIQRIYLKDVSLELPNAPEIFLAEESPTFEVNVSVGAQRLHETIFESSIRATIKAVGKDNKVYYLVEVVQAGIFSIVGYPEEQLDPILGIACPTELFTYLRANVDDLLVRASLPPAYLASMNFQALYEQRIAELMQQAEQNGDTAESAPVKGN